MFNKFHKLFIMGLVVTLPILASAQVLRGTTNILGGIKNLVTVYLIPIAFTLALLFFFWGVAMYIWSVGGGKDEGKQVMIWGVIALFVMSSVWGLVYFLREELDLVGDNTVPIPTIGGRSSGGGRESDADFDNRIAP